MARLSLANTVPIGPWPDRLVKWLGPFSKTVTCQPALASSIAANDPPAPLPITIAVVMLVVTCSWLQGAEEPEDVGDDPGADDRVAAVGPLHFAGGVAARLDVAGEADLLPADEAPVAAVFGAGVQALDGVLEQQRGELAHRSGGQDLVLPRRGLFREVAAGQLVEGLDSRGVPGLPGGQAPAPGDPGHRVEGGEAGHHVRTRRVPVAPRAAGEDLVVLEGAEHGVDVAGHAGLAGAGVARLGRVVPRAGGDPRGRRLDHGGLVGGEEAERRWFALRCGCAGGEPGGHGDGGDDRAAA